MAMKPISSAGGASVDAVMAEIMEAMPKDEVFIKNSQGKMVGTGMRVTSQGTLLAPEKFGVESGSVDMGDLLTLSEAAGYLAILNHSDNNQYYMVDYNVPKTGPSGMPRFFKLTEAENIFQGQADGSKVINLNPLTFTYTTKLNARTNSLFMTAASAMKNVKIRIYRQDVGVTFKYLPSKAAWQNPNVAGYDFVAGENKIDFLDSPLPLDSGIMLTFEIKADNIALRGSSSNVPMLKAMVQRGESVELVSADRISPDMIRDALTSLQSPNKLPKTAIQDGVFSVNGSYGDVVITAETLGVQPRSANLEKVSSIDLLPSSLLYSDDTSGLRTTALSSFVRQALSIDNEELFRNYLGLSSASTLDTNVPNGILQLDEEGKIPSSMLELTLAEVAYSGEYDDLTGRPDLFSGDYEDLQNKPSLFSGNYSDLVGSPDLFSGSYNDLSDKPVIPDEQVNSDWNATSGPAEILNKPVIPVVNYPVKSVNAKTGDVVLTSGDVGAAPATHNHSIADISNLQAALDSKRNTADSIPYSSLSGAPNIPAEQVNSDWLSTSGKSQILNKPALFSGSYSDLTNKPTLFDGTWNSLTGKPTFSTVAVSGNYADLSNKPVIPAAQVQSDWNQSVTTAVDYIKNKPVLFDGNYNNLTNKPTIPTVNYPVTSVNSKTGAVVLSNADVGAAAAVHTHVIGDITGLQSSLDNKITSGSQIPYSTLTGTPSIPVNNSFSFKGLNDTDDTAVANGFLRWNSSGSSISYSTTIPYSALSGAPSLAMVATTGLYSDLTGRPTIPTNVSQLTNDSGYITSNAVSSVNGKTGAVVLSATDVGAATSAQGTKYYRTNNTQATGVKVKYYNVTSDANGAWTLSLGTDFTEVLDVQAQAVSTAGITGVRQSTVNAFTSTSTTITGMTWGNTVLVTVLVSGTNSLSLTPNTVVRVRVEGVGN